MFKTIFKYTIGSLAKGIGWVYRQISAHQDSIYAALLKEIAKDLIRDYLRKNPGTTDIMLKIDSLIQQFLELRPVGYATAARIVTSAANEIKQETAAK